MSWSQRCGHGHGSHEKSPIAHASGSGRRAFLGSAVSLAALATMGTALRAQSPDTFRAPTPEGIRYGSRLSRNISGITELNWQPYFERLGKGGAIFVDVQKRTLHFWSADERVYRIFPTSVPMSEDLTRRGRTHVVKMVEGPSWRPTPAMKERNPDWPDFVGPGPDNPLGTHALHLSWQYFRIHGTHNPRKIGRKSSNGCFGLFNAHISELYEIAKVGTQVLVV